MAMISPTEQKVLQRNKIAKIQQKIDTVEQQMMERSALLNRLEYLNDVENDRTERIISRLGIPKREMVIDREARRLYGRDHGRRHSDIPAHRSVVEDIIHHRNKEFSLSQQEKAMQIKYLSIERQRLQDARERLRERRNNLMYAPTPVGKETMREWGDKYKLYTPLQYDEMFDIYSPRYSCRSPFLPANTWACGKKYTFRPKQYFKKRKRPFYVAVPLYQSLDLW